MEEAQRRRRLRLIRRYSLAIAGGIAGIIGTLAAVPGAVGFVRDSWCWAMSCEPRNQPQIATKPKVQPPQTSAKEEVTSKSRDPNNACFYDYMMFGSRANAVMRLTKLEPGRKEVFTLIIMDCNPVMSEFDVRRRGSGIWGYHGPDSLLYDDTLKFTVHFWMPDPPGNAPISCSFESTERISVRAYEGNLSCDHIDLNNYSTPVASSKNERVTVTLFECDKICQEVVLPGELENNGHGPQEYLKDLEGAQRAENAVD